MKFPNNYIKKGKFKLHSGEITDTFYDVNEFLTNMDNLIEVCSFISETRIYYDTYVGIATGGAIIASQFFDFAMVKDGELTGKVKGKYCLIDDVVTTENSLKEAIKLVGRKPKDIYVVVDRRKNKTLSVKTVCSVEVC